MSVATGLAALEAAFQWCCRRRKDSPPDADIWHLWFHWPAVRQTLLTALRDNRYRLSPLQITGRGRDAKAVWSAQDAVVLKWVAMQLQTVLPVHPLCEHHKGHGGGKRSVQRMHDSLQREGWQYVCRTDIQGFYGHIRRGPLMRQLKRHVQDPVLLALVRQYLHYSVERGGEFHTPKKGVCRGCALSPLLTGFCLWAMDTYFEAQPHLRYVRFMDDIVILTRTRWHLRQAVRALNVFFASGGYRQHPDKTFIGRAERGFDWMGTQFNGSGIEGVAPRALANHRERCRRLYEQVWRHGKKRTMARVSAYVKRWTIWRNSMTDSVRLRTRACRLLSAGWLAATLALVGLASPTAAFALDSCARALSLNTSVSGPNGGNLNGVTPVNVGTPNVYPAFTYLASGTTKPGQQTRCLMGSNKTISIILGSFQTSSWTWTTTGANVWFSTRFSLDDPLYFGATENDNMCTTQSNYNSGYCYRVQPTLQGPLVCTGADGTKSGTPSSGTRSAYGGETVTVECRDRTDGTGVDLIIPPTTTRFFTASPYGYAVSGSITPNQNTSPPSSSILLGGSPTAPAPTSTCDSHVGADPTGCVPYLPIMPTNIILPQSPTGTCTASLEKPSIDFPTVHIQDVLTVGQPLPSVTTLATAVYLRCTGTDAGNASRVIVTARGAPSSYNGVFTSTNDSVGFQLKAGNKGSILANGVQQVITASQGVIVTPGAGNQTLTTTISATPIALTPDLLPGRATATITLDLYAAAD